MESTAALLTVEEAASPLRSQASNEWSTGKGHLNDRKNAFSRFTLTVLLYGILAIVLACSLAGLLTWYIRRVTSTKIDFGLRIKGGYGDFGDVRYFADPRGVGGVIGPLAFQAAAPMSNQDLITASPNNASPLVHSATTHRTSKKIPSRARRLKLSRVAAASAKAEPCTTAGCRNQSEYLKSQLNFSVNPCHDLYDFVCGKYQGHPDGPYAQAENDLRSATISALAVEDTPLVGQTAWQKAAGLFQACLSLAKSSSDQLQNLKSWMVSLNLDVVNYDAPTLVDPVDMTVRLAIEIGVPAIFDFWFFDDTFHEGKRAMKFKISDFQEAWHKKRDQLKQQSPDKYTEYFANQLQLYPGYAERNSTYLEKMLLAYDEALVTVIGEHVKPSSIFVIRVIEDMGKLTPKHITSDQWGHMVGTYTKGIYRHTAMIHFQKELLLALEELLGASNWGKDGFRAMLAWRLFDSLSDYVQPAKLVGGRDKQEVCYSHVREVMEFAITSRYLRPRVSLDTVKKSEEMFSNAREAFRAALKSSSWLKNTVLEFTHRNLDRMTVRAGSLGHILDESFVNRHYASFPDMAPTGPFFDEWVKARSARSHEKWSDLTRIHFNMSRVSAYYVVGSHAVIIPAGALQPFFFYPDGNTALNYGTLGDSLARQIMNGYDVTGPMNYCYHEYTRWDFNKRLQCIRNSHAKPWLTNRTRKGHDPAEAENVAELVGTAAAFEAFQRLPSARQTEPLPGLNLTTAQLFFVGHCMTTCNMYSLTPKGRFASARARCNVPAMNMAAFSAAFRCGRSERMNPARKCSFWG